MKAKTLTHLATQVWRGNALRLGIVAAGLVGGAVLASPAFAGSTGSAGRGPAAPAAPAAPVFAAGDRTTRTTPQYKLADALPAGWTMTQWGPLTPADRDVLNRVKQAGLWERPSGLWAQTMASSQRVKEVGAQLAADHLQLDQSVEAVAKKLGVTLPQSPTAEQEGWMKEERDAKTPQDFDRIFTERLRAAHGKVFTIIAATRSGTRNDLVRQFAQVGINVVMKHMTLLESTTLVDYNALPTPPAPAVGPAQAAAATRGTSDDNRNALIWVVLALALLAGVPAAIRVIRLR
jgi:predicted outer membrane protein